MNDYNEYALCAIGAVYEYVARRRSKNERKRTMNTTNLVNYVWMTAPNISGWCGKLRFFLHLYWLFQVKERQVKLVNRNSLKGWRIERLVSVWRQNDLTFYRNFISNFTINVTNFASAEWIENDNVKHLKQERMRGKQESRKGGSQDRELDRT